MGLSPHTGLSPYGAKPHVGLSPIWAKPHMGPSPSRQDRRRVYFVGQNRPKISQIRLLRVKLCRMRRSAALGDFSVTFSGPTSCLLEQKQAFYKNNNKSQQNYAKFGFYASNCVDCADQQLLAIFLANVPDGRRAYSKISIIFDKNCQKST